MYSSYVLRKVSGLSFNMEKENKFISLNYDLNNFKEVLDRAKYDVNNVVNIR